MEASRLFRLREQPSAENVEESNEISGAPTHLDGQHRSVKNNLVASGGTGGGQTQQTSYSNRNNPQQNPGPNTSNTQNSNQIQSQCHNNSGNVSNVSTQVPNSASTHPSSAHSSVQQGGAQQQVGGSSGSTAGASQQGSQQSQDLSSYAFFAKYTYTTECALLAYNFHEILRRDLRVFDYFDHSSQIYKNSTGQSLSSSSSSSDANNPQQKSSKYDHRLVSVTLAFLFYKYQIHHCDMALDLALTLTYLEDLVLNLSMLEACFYGKGSLPSGFISSAPTSVSTSRMPGGPGAAILNSGTGSGSTSSSNAPSITLQKPSHPPLFAQTDAFNVITYLSFLAHAFNADRTIRLKDWHTEIGWRHFPTLKMLNAFVFFLFSKIRKFRLQVSESRVKKYIQKLCSVPQRTDK